MNPADSFAPFGPLPPLPFRRAPFAQDPEHVERRHGSPNCGTGPRLCGPSPLKPAPSERPAMSARSGRIGRALWLQRAGNGRSRRYANLRCAPQDDQPSIVTPSRSDQIRLNRTESNHFSRRSPPPSEARAEALRLEAWREVHGATGTAESARRPWCNGGNSYLVPTSPVRPSRLKPRPSLAAEPRQTPVPRGRCSQS